MTTEHWHLLWEACTGIGTVAMAIATAVLAGVAWWTSSSWLQAQRNERADNSISAAGQLQSMIGKIISLKKSTYRGTVSTTPAWDAYNRAWDAMTRLNQAIHVAARYHEGWNPNDIATRLRTELERFEPLLRIDGWSGVEANAIRDAIADLLQPLYQRFARAQ
jgi:hypothetical protein